MRGEIQDEGAVRVARTLPNCEMAADDCESHIRRALPKSPELSPVAATFASQLRSPRSFLPIALNFPARHLPPVCALAGPPVGRNAAAPGVRREPRGDAARRGRAAPGSRGSGPDDSPRAAARPPPPGLGPPPP